MALRARNTELDAKFGELLEPKYLRDVEKLGSFSNTFLLDAHAANFLNIILNLAGGQPTFRNLAENLCFLWLVDERGETWITMEEVCLLSDLGRRFPRMRNMPLHSSLDTLGHPLLVKLGKARIAGELILDTDDTDLFWLINNKSGRYGFGPKREERHLDNVAIAMKALGLIVDTHYIKGR
jgi:hypothetical protein